MKRGLVFLSLVIAYVLSSPLYVFAYTSPGHPTGYVNDFAHVLSAETKQNLESELASFQATSSSEITVATVQNMGGDYIENYAVKLFEEWKIGKRDKDNGVLLLLSVEERKLRIEVGYGLEGALPDSVAQRILDNEMTPRLKAGDYDGAVTAGVHAIETAIRGEYISTNKNPDVAGIFSWLFQDGWLVVVVGLLVLQWLAAILGRSRSWWAGGVVGLAGGISIGWLLALGFLLTLPIAILLLIFGLVFDYVVSSTFRGAKNRGGIPPWWSGGSGGFSSSGGGGFGGFGGGSSGGGGASGGW